MTHKALEGCTEPLTPLPPISASSPFLPQPPHLPTPKYTLSLQNPAHQTGRARTQTGADNPGRWGGIRGLWGLVGMDEPQIPSPLRRKNLPSVPHSSSLLSCSQTSLPAPVALGNVQLALTSLLSPVHSPRPGGRRRAWPERGLCPATPACLRGWQQGRHCPLSATQLQGPAATAQPEPCWGRAAPGAGLAQWVPGTATGKSWPRLLETPPRAQEGRQHRQGHRLNEGLRDQGGGDIEERVTHAQGPHGASSTAPASPQPKTRLPAPHPRGAGAPCPRGVPPQRPPWCAVLRPRSVRAPSTQPHTGAAAGPSGAGAQRGELAASATRRHLRKYLSGLWRPGSGQHRDKAGKGGGRGAEKSRRRQAERGWLPGGRGARGHPRRGVREQRGCAGSARGRPTPAPPQSCDPPPAPGVPWAAPARAGPSADSGHATAGPGGPPLSAEAAPAAGTSRGGPAAPRPVPGPPTRRAAAGGRSEPRHLPLPRRPLRPQP